MSGKQIRILPSLLYAFSLRKGEDCTILQIPLDLRLALTRMEDIP